MMKNNIKKYSLLLIFFFFLSSISVSAAYMLSANIVYVSSSKTEATNVQDALDELYEKCNNTIPKANNFATDSWETIAYAVRSGNYPYEVGDTKTIVLSEIKGEKIVCTGTYTPENIPDNCYEQFESAQTVTVRVANTTACTGDEAIQTACGFVIEFVDLIAKKPMNFLLNGISATSLSNYNTNVGSYRKTTIENFFMGYIFNALPEDLQDIIQYQTVIAGYGSAANSTFSITGEKLYLLSGMEVFGSSVTNENGTGYTRQLDYYANQGVTTSNGNAIIKYYKGESTSWWLRSADSSTNTKFHYAGKAGSYGSALAGDYSFGISPAFKIG